MAAALSPFGMAFAGAVGGVVSNSIVYPLDTVKTRIQTSIPKSAALPTTAADANAKPTAPAPISARAMLVKILKEQGIAGLYQGYGASMLNTFSMQFAYFYWYTIVRRTYLKRFPAVGGKLNTVTELVLGALAAAFAQLFTIPVSVIATRQQLATKHISFIKTLKDILKDDGITGLWRGLKPSLVLTVNPAITYGMFERLKSLLLAEGEKVGPGKAFGLGAMSKTMATVVTYPYIMAKTRLQAKYDEAEDEEVKAEATAPATDGGVAAAKRKERYSGAIDCLTQVYKEQGFTGWYQGMQAQIVKAVLSQALLFGIKDALEAYVVVALIWYARTSGRAVGVKSL